MNTLQSLATVVLAALPNLNPATSDPMEGKMWIIVAALVVSAVLIIVLAVTSSRKKGKGKKKRK